MKRTLLFVIGLFLAGKISSQTVLKPYLGVNYSNARTHVINNATGSDSSAWRRDWIFLLKVGMDVQMSINNRLCLNTGLGASWLGSKNYNTLAGPTFYIPSDCKIGYIEVPVTFAYNLFGQAHFFGGAYLGYSFRKNQNFYYADSIGVTFNIYNPFQVGATYGVRYDVLPLSFEFGVYHGLVNIYNTGEINPEGRAYMKLMAFQLKVAYIIEDRIN